MQNYLAYHQRKENIAKTHLLSELRLKRRQINIIENTAITPPPGTQGNEKFISSLIEKANTSIEETKTTRL